MPAIRGLTVSVGQHYASLLRQTLWRNMRHMTECVVATLPGDPSVEVASVVPGVRVLETDAFVRPDKNGNRPMFGKGLGVEEALTFLGRHGWTLIWDADILLPPSLPLGDLDPSTLYGAKRRIMEDPSRWHDGLADPETWRQFPPSRDGGPIGFHQLFHASAPALPKRWDTEPRTPWYDVSYPHGGGCDFFFMEHWRKARQPLKVLPYECLHLGKVDKNWFGTSKHSQAMMAKYVTDFNLARGIRNFSPGEAGGAGQLPPRLEYEGYERSDCLMPFERRAMARHAVAR